MKRKTLVTSGKCAHRHKRKHRLNERRKFMSASLQMYLFILKAMVTIVNINKWPNKTNFSSKIKIQIWKGKCFFILNFYFFLRSQYDGKEINLYFRFLFYKTVYWKQKYIELTLYRMFTMRIRWKKSDMPQIWSMRIL